MAVLLWCVKCGREQVIAGDVPIVCPAPACRAVTTWTTSQPYRATEQDRRWLRSIHVESTEPESA